MAVTRGLDVCQSIPARAEIIFVRLFVAAWNPARAEAFSVNNFVSGKSLDCGICYVFIFIYRPAFLFCDFENGRTDLCGNF